MKQAVEKLGCQHVGMTLVWQLSFLTVQNETLLCEVVEKFLESLIRSKKMQLQVRVF